MDSSQAPANLHSISSNLMSLPSELHIQISSYLCYPDALALKHSSRHFYYMVSTGVQLKIDWLIERIGHKLECPMEKCSFRTDESFCNGCVRGIMERRRWHVECGGVEGGCLVVNGKTCQTGLIPTWFKAKLRGRRKIARIVRSWGHEGSFRLCPLPSSHGALADGMLHTVFLIGALAIALHLLWYLVQR